MSLFDTAFHGVVQVFIKVKNILNNQWVNFIIFNRLTLYSVNSRKKVGFLLKPQFEP